MSGGLYINQLECNQCGAVTPCESTKENINCQSCGKILDPSNPLFRSAIDNAYDWVDERIRSEIY